MSRRPTVSVIVPTFNEAERIDKLLTALLLQDYPRESVEIIVVDNNSRDATRAIVAVYPVTLLEETEQQNPDAARNRGLAHARGDVLAFTDADCMPEPDWLSNGVAAISASDLVAGQISFEFSPARRAGELYDAVTNLRNDLGVAQRGVAFTANLFARRAVFERFGPFSLAGGGDAILTRKAIAAGLRLAFAPGAVVRHPARRAGELLRKAARVGREQGHAVRRAELPMPVARAAGMRPQFAHLLPWRLRASFHERGIRVRLQDWLTAYGVGWLYVLVGGAAFAKAYAGARSFRF